MLLLPMKNPVLPHVTWSQRDQGHALRSKAQWNISSNSQYCSLYFYSVIAPQPPDVCVYMPDCSARVELSFLQTTAEDFQAEGRAVPQCLPGNLLRLCFFSLIFRCWMNAIISQVLSLFSLRLQMPVGQPTVANSKLKCWGRQVIFLEMFKEKCHSQAQKGDEIQSVSLDFHGPCHNVLIFFSNYKRKSQTERDPKIKNKEEICSCHRKRHWQSL